jgi:hypothetical protein
VGAPSLDLFLPQFLGKAQKLTLAAVALKLASYEAEASFH